MPATDPGAPLAALAAIADEVGAGRLADDARALAARVAEGRFFVACVGQFKRGKSTLLDALVGEPILPAGVVPVTAVPTILRHGRVRAARVRIAEGHWLDVPPEALDQYVAEAHNPENVKGVAAVEVFVPSPLLTSGLCLVDTPGLGSVFAGNTAATRAFVPHVDAALVVIGADPPLAGEELGLVEEVARDVPDLIVVLNKADRTTDAERREAVAFAAGVLERRLSRPVGPILEVSAAEQLATVLDPDRAGTMPPRDWPTLVAALHDLQARSGRALVRTAASRGVARLAATLRGTLDEQRAALTRPVAESERRLAVLARCVAEASHRALELGHLFASAQQRLGREFAERRTAFVARVLPDATAELTQAVAAEPGRWGPAVRERAYRAAREISRRLLEPWLAGEQQAAERAYAETADCFVAQADAFLDAARRAWPGGLEQLPVLISGSAGEGGTGFRVPSRYYVREVLPLTYGSPLRTLLDAAGPPAWTRAGVLRDATAYLRDLLSMNSTLVENDLDERVAESRRRLEAELQHVLHEVYVGVERALARARTLHAAGTAAVGAEVARLDLLAERLAAVRSAAIVDSEIGPGGVHGV